jgi:hypothetical protein
MKFLRPIDVETFLKFDLKINFTNITHIAQTEKSITQNKSHNSCRKNERTQNMNFNFFEWIREGVKQSVLMGVSDAVKTMGTPHDEKIAKESILGFLQTNAIEDNTKRRVTSAITTTSTTGSKKLGRSITEIQ